MIYLIAYLLSVIVVAFGAIWFLHEDHPGKGEDHIALCLLRIVAWPVCLPIHLVSEYGYKVPRWLGKQRDRLKLGYSKLKAKLADLRRPTVVNNTVINTPAHTDCPYCTPESGKEPLVTPAPEKFQPGDLVRLKSDARSYDGFNPGDLAIVVELEDIGFSVTEPFGSRVVSGCGFEFWTLVSSAPKPLPLSSAPAKVKKRSSTKAKRKGKK